MKYEYNTIANSEYLGDRFLNKLGEEGWELVSHTYIPTTVNHYYTFKREKVSKPEAIEKSKTDPKSTPIKGGWI